MWFASSDGALCRAQIMDLGGASTQIVFQPKRNAALRAFLDGV
jgi:hypothetical protein